MKTIRLTGDALTAARTVYQTRQLIKAQIKELEREFRERMAALERDAQERMNLAWVVLMKASGLPMDELGEWELDVSYMEDHDCAFLNKREGEGEEAQHPSLGDLLQPQTALRH